MTYFRPFSQSVAASLLWPGGRRPRTVIVFGDSLTLGSSTFNATSANYEPGYAELAIRRAGKQVEIANKGIGGNTTTQMVARFQADVIDNRPDAVLLLAGTNDIVAGMTTAQIVTCMNNMQAMVRMCLDAGILPILVTPPPKNSAPIEAQNIQRYYYDMAHRYRVPLIDIYRLLVNAQNGNYAAGLSDDGTHWNAAGRSLVAAKVAECLADVDAWQNPLYLASVSASVSDSGWNLVRNGSFALDVPPPGPDGWTVNTTDAVLTTPAVSYPYTGNEVNYVQSVSGGRYVLYGANVSLVPGNRIRFSGAVAISDRAAPTTFQMEVAWTGGQFRPMATWVENGDFQFSAEMAVPDGIVLGTPRIWTGDVGTYKVRNLTIVDVTAQRAIWAPGN